MYVSQGPCRLAALKGDIDSAYRRVPVAPEHREFARVVFKHEEQIWEAGHLGMPFGSLASLHGWDRIGKHPLLTWRQIHHTHFHDWQAPC